MIRIPVTITSVALATACATIPDVAVAPEGTTVAISEPVRNGQAVITAIRVGEDSRCAIDVQCIWAGRLVVLVEVDRKGMRQQGLVTLGEGTLFSTETPASYYAVTLDAASPEKTTEGNIAQDEYRFRFGTGAAR